MDQNNTPNVVVSLEPVWQDLKHRYDRVTVRHLVPMKNYHKCIFKRRAVAKINFFFLKR